MLHNRQIVRMFAHALAELTTKVLGFFLGHGFQQGVIILELGVNVNTTVLDDVYLHCLVLSQLHDICTPLFHLLLLFLRSHISHYN